MALGKLLRLDVDYSKRVFGLDLMRSIAIITVVIVHGSMLEEAGTNFPWIPLIDGVELFFVLSGFLIGNILLKLFLDRNDLSFKVLVNFWIRRWFRTLPNYYLILFINFLLAFAGLVSADLDVLDWRFFTFMQNFDESYFKGFFWESWSISIEEWFYLLFPLLLAFFYLLNRLFCFTKRIVYLMSLLAFLITPLFLRWFMFKGINLDYNSFMFDISVVVIYRLDSIAWGLLAAYILRFFPELWSRGRLIYLIFGVLGYYAIIYSQVDYNSFFGKNILVSARGLCCALTLPFFQGIRSAPKIWLRPITHISLISYSMYLINLGIVASIINTHFRPYNASTAWLSYFAYWFFVILISTVLFKYFERPVLNLRDRIRI